jgi:hypothetical protein
VYRTIYQLTVQPGIGATIIVSCESVIKKGRYIYDLICATVLPPPHCFVGFFHHLSRLGNLHARQENKIRARKGRRALSCGWGRLDFSILFGACLCCHENAMFSAPVEQWTVTIWKRTCSARRAAGGVSGWLSYYTMQPLVLLLAIVPVINERLPEKDNTRHRHASEFTLAGPWPPALSYPNSHRHTCAITTFFFLIIASLDTIFYFFSCFII